MEDSLAPRKDVAANTFGALRSAGCVAVLFVLASPACVTLGPSTLSRDRFDYGTEIGDSWKRQTLINLVRMRYYDLPVFVDVGQIVGGYTLETGVSGGGAFLSGGGPDSWTLGGSSKLTDRPTITYVPVTGNDFLRALMTPMSPESVLFAVQANWPADLVFGLSVISINGLRNQRLSMGGTAPGDPDFFRVVQFMREVQRSGAFDMRIREGKEGERSTVLFIRRNNLPEDLLTEAQHFRDALRLDPERNDYRLVYGSLPSGPDEIAVQTRSMLQVMLEIAAIIEVPPEDISSGRATAGASTLQEVAGALKALRIKTSKGEPDSPFVSARYHDNWFYIADTDLRSKGVFSFLMLMFTLADTSERQELPLITIPAG
jgi:hypothetical protein